MRLATVAPQPSVVLSKERPAHAINLLLQLPLELVDLILDLLPPADVWATQRVCKACHNRFWSYDQLRREQLTLTDLAFGAGKWLKYYGLKVSDVPPVPLEIYALLDQECRIWPGRRVRDTHLLTLIPKGLTLNHLEELIQHPLNGDHATQYHDRKDCYEPYVGRELGDKAIPASYWVLMTRHILPDSRNKHYSQHQALVAHQAQRTRVPYVMPRTIEAIAGIVTHFVEHKERLYGDDKQDVLVWHDSKQSNSYTYTRCAEKVNGNQWSVVVGCFFSGGLGVYSLYDIWDDFCGVGGVVRWL